jgi:hypothetical protein
VGCGFPVNGAVLSESAAAGQAPTAPALASVKLSPELIEWARKSFSEEEFLAGIREIEETGGLELKDFIRELEQEAGPRDSIA